MKKIKIGFILMLGLTFTACNMESNQENYEDDIAEILADYEDSETATSSRCDDLSIDDFDSFLGVDFDSPEKDLKDIMGKSSGGEYTEDKGRFKYYWKDTKRVPVTIYCNAETGHVETLFMEILGIGKNFDQDVMKADEDFNLKECHLNLFGKQPKEIINIFGQADKDNIVDDSVEDDVRDLVYYSDNDKIALTFKFYHSQDNRMSSLSVDWFHDEE